MVENNWPIFVYFVSSPLFSRCGIQTCKRCLIVVPISIFILRFINIYSPTNYKKLTTPDIRMFVHKLCQIDGNINIESVCWQVDYFMTVNYLNEAVVAVSKPCQTSFTQDCIGCCNVARWSAWTLGDGRRRCEMRGVVTCQQICRSMAQCYLHVPVSRDNEPRVTDIYRWGDN